MEANVKWSSGMAFEADQDGFSLGLDAGAESGGQGKGLQRPSSGGNEAASALQGGLRARFLPKVAAQATVRESSQSWQADVLQEDDVRVLLGEQGKLLLGVRHTTDVPACEAEGHGVSIDALCLSQKRGKGVGCGTAHHH